MKKISSKKSLLATVGAFALPFVALAQGGSSDGIRHLLGIAAGIIQALIPIVIGLAVLVFLWGVLQYVLRSRKLHALGYYRIVRNGFCLGSCKYS